MKWIRALFGRRQKETEGQKQANALLEQLQAQAPEVEKLTHSLSTTRRINHLGARIRLSMEGKRDI